MIKWSKNLKISEKSETLTEIWKDAHMGDCDGDCGLYTEEDDD